MMENLGLNNYLRKKIMKIYERLSENRGQEDRKFLDGKRSKTEMSVKNKSQVLSNQKLKKYKTIFTIFFVLIKNCLT